jgi:hypothetical protein
MTIAIRLADAANELDRRRAMSQQVGLARSLVDLAARVHGWRADIERLKVQAELVKQADPNRQSSQHQLGGNLRAKLQSKLDNLRASTPEELGEATMGWEDVNHHILEALAQVERELQEAWAASCHHERIDEGILAKIESSNPTAVQSLRSASARLTTLQGQFPLRQTHLEQRQEALGSLDKAREGLGAEDDELDLILRLARGASLTEFLGDDRYLQVLQRFDMISDCQVHLR